MNTSRTPATSVFMQENNKSNALEMFLETRPCLDLFFWVSTLQHFRCILQLLVNYRLILYISVKFDVTDNFKIFLDFICKTRAMQTSSIRRGGLSGLSGAGNLARGRAVAGGWWLLSTVYCAGIDVREHVKTFQMK